MERIEFRAMGCQMLVVLDAETAIASEMLAQVPPWFEEWEECFSRFRPGSELSLLNSSKGLSGKVSLLLWNVIQAALDAARASGGLVTPTVLDAVEAAGYDRTFDEVVSLDSQSQAVTMTSPHIPNWREVQTTARTRTVRLPSGVRLDLGGIGKGWAAQQAANTLAEYGPVLVDAGGDIAVSGPMRSGHKWPVGVASPTEPEQQIALLLLARGAIATSGRDYRRWRIGGVWQHHILDPRTGLPAQTDVLSATVVAPDACGAEMAAKSAFILGSREGLRWIEDHHDFAALLVLEDGQILYSKRLSEYLYRGE